MTPLPPPWGSGRLRGWRLDQASFASVWNSGEGAFLYGGRWNSRGTRAVYAALDPATAIIEVAVHKSFRVLDAVPHVLTGFSLDHAADIHAVMPGDLTDAQWLVPGLATADQRRFGDTMLAAHDFVLLPSTVSSHSWNLIFDPVRASGLIDAVEQERFVLDPRLNRAGSVTTR
jgi:RES domain-containing protein